MKKDVFFEVGGFDPAYFFMMKIQIYHLEYKLLDIKTFAVET